MKVVAYIIFLLVVPGGALSLLTLFFEKLKKVPDILFLIYITLIFFYIKLQIPPVTNIPFLMKIPSFHLIFVFVEILLFFSILSIFIRFKRMLKTDSFHPKEIENKKGILKKLFKPQDEKKEFLDDMKELKRMLSESVLFGRLIGINLLWNQYHIVYTHNPQDHKNDCLNNESYLIPSFPMDEAEMVMRLWHLICSTLKMSWSNTRLVCSHFFNDNYNHLPAPKTNQIKSARKEILDSSFSVVGSPSANALCKLVMEKIHELEGTGILQRKKRLFLKVLPDYRGDDNYCYLGVPGFDGNIESVPNLAPTSIPNKDQQDENEILTDYGLIMKLPNIMHSKGINKNQSIMVFAGCKVAAQFAITEWISDPGNFSQFSDLYSNYFQIVLDVKYQFRKDHKPNLYDQNKSLELGYKVLEEYSEIITIGM